MDRLLLLALAAVLCAVSAFAQPAALQDSPEEARDDLAQALADRQQAEERSARFEQAAREAEDAAARTAQQAAAIAARIQQAEAGIAAATARIKLVDRERLDLRERIGREQRPMVRLTAALQQFSRRPVGLALLRPGSVRDLVYLRAVLHDTAPQVRQRTEGFRRAIARGEDLRRTAMGARRDLQAEEQTLGERRRELAEIETQQRLAARSAGGTAGREAQRALALAEEMRDLDALVGELSRAAELREQLAALPGPQIRPARLSEARPSPRPSSTAASENRAASTPFILPVNGRTVAGFGAATPNGPNPGVSISPSPGAQIVSPAQGRIAFAGPYRGFGQIVIIEHQGGWTSLLTGLARADAEIGTMVEAGSPIGVAGPDRNLITFELRRGNEPVNPLGFVE